MAKLIYAQIMAGGTGKRMGNTPLPKQFLMLASKPIIIHTLEKFILNNEFSLILISTPETWIDYTEEIIQKYGINDSRIRVIAGGKERNDTLMNALNFIESVNELTPDDWIICHDAVRPFITKRIIDDNIEALEYYTAVDTVVPAFDTIVRGNDGQIIEIPVRDEMYQGQTPQSFHILPLKSALTNLSDGEKSTLSDSAKVMLLAGEKVGLVNGEQTNMKITTQYDLKMANSLIVEAN